MADPRSMKARKERADARKDIMSKPAIRNALQAAAKKNNTSIGKSAVDNFINTYKNTKVGPIQRAIANLFKSDKPGGSYLKQGTKPDRDRKAQANRATSQGGRSRKQAIEANQIRLAGKSKAGGGKAVLSQMPQKAANKIAASDANMNIKKTVPKPKAKPWKDFKSVAAAQKAGLNYFTGRDGKKKIAVTAEQLKKKYPNLSSSAALRKYANSIKGKK